MDKTLSRLSQRHLNRPGATGKERTPAPLGRKSNKPERARQSLHFANQSMKDIDEAYRKAAHDVYPQRLNKAAFIEAMITIGLKHSDETVALALERQAEEEEEE